MRVAILAIGVETDLLERRANTHTAFVWTHGWLLDRQAFLDDLANRKPRREGAIGVLKNHLHLLAERSHCLRIQLINAVTHIGNSPPGGNEPEQRKTQGRLPRSRLANN